MAIKIGLLVDCKFGLQENIGLVQELNPEPLTPKARIMPLDQQAFLEMK